MGYGGELIWTSVFKTLHEHDNREILVAHTPKLSDLLAGRLYDRSAALDQRQVFIGNPRLKFLPAVEKALLTRLFDRGFDGFLAVSRLRRAYERLVFRLVGRRPHRGLSRLVHIDMRILSYAERETRERMIWKSGGHAVATILRSFDLVPASTKPELYLDADDERRARQLLLRAGVQRRYIVLEPETNRDWFGDLRAWPFERWVTLATALREKRPDMALVQVGLPSANLLPGATDLRGQTTFRGAAAVIKGADLFIGTDGGLMHAARATDAPSLILWGGVNMPEFLGYPDHHTIICHRVSCAPCGQKGWCNNGHICMRGISVEETLAAALTQLQSARVNEIEESK